MSDDAAAAVAIRGNLRALRDLLLQTPMQPSHLSLSLSLCLWRGAVMQCVCVGGERGIKRGWRKAYARRYHIKERERETSELRAPTPTRAHADPSIHPPTTTMNGSRAHNDGNGIS